MRLSVLLDSDGDTVGSGKSNAGDFSASDGCRVRDDCQEDGLEETVKPGSIGVNAGRSIGVRVGTGGTVSTKA